MEPNGVSVNDRLPADAESGQVCLGDVKELVLRAFVLPPIGFTKMGLPMLVFPDGQSEDLPEDDLHLLFKYYLAVVPRSEQSLGFALILDRRLDEWTRVRTTFHQIVSLFPARIREVYLLHHHPHAGKDAVAHSLIQDFMLDFDIYLADEPGEVSEQLDTSALPAQLGGQMSLNLDKWMGLQQMVESFSFSARRIAKKLAHFVGVLNHEDLNYRAESLRDVASKNRSVYGRLRKDLEDLTQQGHLLQTSLQSPDTAAHLMQRMAVQVLCKQLDQAWTYFSRSWKMQDHVYVQYLELNAFQQRFRQLANTMAEKERILLQDLPAAGCTAAEVSDALSRVDSLAHSLALDEVKARELSKIGQELLQDHNFATDCIQPKCAELKLMCQNLEQLLTHKRNILHKFLLLAESLQAANKWCDSCIDHLQAVHDLASQSGDLEDDTGRTIMHIRQTDYLLSKSSELKIRSRQDFDQGFEALKPHMVPQMQLSVDHAVGRLEAVTLMMIQRRDQLRQKATAKSERKMSLQSGSSPDAMLDESVKMRRENVMSELISTESRYVSDLGQVLKCYQDKLSMSNLTETRHKSGIIFGNLSQIHDFHSGVFYPQLERCGANPVAVAKSMLVNLSEVRQLYTAYCQNMPASRQAIADLGGEVSPSILFHCQQEAGHALPLSSYLLKPMQRLTKYQLLLKDLADSCSPACGKAELEQALNELLSVVKIVNDSMHSISIKALPKWVSPLGALVAHDVFQVQCTENNNKASQILFRHRNGQRRQVFLYENFLLFVKPLKEPNQQQFQFKSALPIADVKVCSSVRNDDRKLEVWCHGRNELYTLEAKTPKAKNAFSTDLTKVILKKQRQVTPGTGSVNSSSNRMSRSRSLESNRASMPLRSRSVDCANNDDDYPGDDNHHSEDNLIMDNAAAVRNRRRSSSRNRTGSKYVALADYTAVTSREVDLAEDDVVELIKVGCSGWWYVRVNVYPFLEGWAPSTYLEKMVRHPD